ncbi:MAG TPA: tetratricopeptide repeat protein [Terriglobia bacterium]|nr:tetratricopeptide repeat protein [Terriglobia bacterium]
MSDAAATSGVARPDLSLAADADSRTARWRSWLPTVVLLLLATLPYLNSLWNGFVYDDDTQVLSNPYIQNFTHLKQIFTTTVWSYQGGAMGVTNYYRPLMTFGYLLIHQAFGYRPFYFHLVNILTNAAVVLALYLLTLGMFGDRTIAFLAAALFALHPIHTEAVNWIAAITDLELTLFFLLAFWFFLSLARPRDRRWWLGQSGLGASFLLCLLSKEQAMMLPVLATAYEHFYRPDQGETNLWEKLSRYGLFWMMGTGTVIFRIHTLGAFAPHGQKKDFGLDEVVFYAAGLIGQYLKKLIWPVHLHVYYAFPPTIGEWVPQMLAGLLAAGVFALVFTALWRWARPVSFGCVWFALTLAPVLDVRLLPNCVFAERYLYLPSVGFCWIAAWGMAWVWRKAGTGGRSWRTVMATAGLLTAALCSIRIFTQNPAWKDDLTFYQAALANAPHSADMHNNLGIIYWRRHDLPQAEQEWHKAYQLEPRSIFALDNLGLLCSREKRYGEAEYYLQKALLLSPHDVTALVNLGQTEEYLGHQAEAEADLRQAVAVAPLNVRALVKLGELLQDEGKSAEAAVQFQSALRSQPTLRAYYGLGLAQWSQGNTRQAEQTFLQSVALIPADSRSHFLLGLLYENTGRPQQALEQYRAGLRTDPSNAMALAAVRRLTQKAAPALPPKPKSH